MRPLVGLAVSLAKTATCVINKHGPIVKEAQVASAPEALLRWIREEDGSIVVIDLEAAPMSQW